MNYQVEGVESKQEVERGKAKHSGGTILYTVVLVVIGLHTTRMVGVLENCVSYWERRNLCETQKVKVFVEFQFHLFWLELAYKPPLTHSKRVLTKQTKRGVGRRKPFYSSHV